MRYRQQPRDSELLGHGRHVVRRGVRHHIYEDQDPGHRVADDHGNRKNAAVLRVLEIRRAAPPQTLPFRAFRQVHKGQVLHQAQPRGTRHRRVRTAGVTFALPRPPRVKRRVLLQTITRARAQKFKLTTILLIFLTFI